MKLTARIVLIAVMALCAGAVKANSGNATTAKAAGSTLDGEVLSGMSFTSNSQLWNYRAAGEPWNFWFIYTLINKPTVVENGETVEDERDKVYTIYFDDVRPLRAPENRPDNLGLFFKIKYFGPAVSDEYTP